MIITADHIRRFPFAVSPRRITPDLQSLIARDMADAARKEGHRMALPTIKSQKAEDIELARCRVEAHVFRCLSQFGAQTITAIRSVIGIDRHKIDNALVYMVADGRVKRINRPTCGGSVPAVFQINPHYSPATGQCDPAQPGNPTGEDADAETGMSHLHHAACCIMFLVAYEARKTGQDDRPRITARTTEAAKMRKGQAI